MSYEDSTNLKRIKITRENETDYHLKSRRGKTNQFYDQYLCKSAIELMEKYENHPEVSIVGGVIPQKSNQEINSQLKKITSLLELPVILKTHVGRRTFRQIIGDAGVVQDGTIKKLMGHANQTIDSRYYNVNQNPLLVAKKLIDTFIQQNIE